MSNQGSACVTKFGTLQRGWFHWHVVGYDDADLDAQKMLHDALHLAKGKRGGRPVRVQIIVEVGAATSVATPEGVSA